MKIKSLLAAATERPLTYAKCRCGDSGCRSYTLNTQGSAGFVESDAALYAALANSADALVRLVEAARLASKSYTPGLQINDPNKGPLNYVADALAALESHPEWK